MKNQHVTSKQVLFVGVATLCGSMAYACQVPVFRYALERWNADKYQVIVLSNGKLTEQDRTALAPLAKLAMEQSGAKSRIEFTAIEAAALSDPLLGSLWAKHADHSQPMLAAFYPAKSSAPANVPAYVDSLSEASVAAMLDSPVRREVQQLLVAGHSAVWVLLESGDELKDEAAFATLETQLALDADLLKLPTAEELEVEPEVLAKTKIKLQVKFAIVRLNRRDPAERFLVETLLNSESDLKDYNEPLAFPVFGRGRVLYALVGKGIGADTIRTASSFIVGPCSCQVKNQNPGFDLLMLYDWDAAVGETLISEPIENLPSDREPKLLAIPPG